MSPMYTTGRLSKSKTGKSKQKQLFYKHFFFLTINRKKSNFQKEKMLTN